MAAVVQTQQQPGNEIADLTPVAADITNASTSGRVMRC